MEQLEKIKTQYMLMEEIPVKDISDVFGILGVYLNDVNESKRTASSSILRNNFDYKVGSIKRTVNEFLGYEEDFDYLIEDTEVLKQHILLAGSYEEKFLKLREKLNDDNFLVMSRLIQFTHDNYINNFNYLESVRDSIGFAAQGIEYYGVYEDDSEAFSVFFLEEFTNILSKGREKTKL